MREHTAANLGQEIAALIRDFAEGRDLELTELRARVRDLESENADLLDQLEREETPIYD